MPWTSADAKRFKKGLSPKQARQWAAVANSALAKCEDEGGKDCEKRAIMQANGVTGTPKKKEDVIALDAHDLEGRIEVVQENEAEEKMGSMYTAYVPYGIASFRELEMAQAAQEKTHEVSVLVDQLHMLMTNVISDPQVDSTTGITQLLSEFTQRVEAAMSLKQAEKELDEEEADEKSAIKRENGIDFPRGDYAYVPDPSLPSTWKLRLTESPGKVTVAQLGRAAAALSAGGFRGQKAQIPDNALSAVKRRIRSEYRKLKVEENAIPASVKEAFSIWKEASGQYRFMAVYSNNFRDDDNPPEIISAKSHTNFVEMVDEGIVDYPELWHYHVPGTRWGKADMVDFVDGFAIASGTIDPGHEVEAETLKALIDAGADIRMSHGMPVKTIVRNVDDPTIIDFHVTKEISDLPGMAAANKLTDFVVMESKETEMPLSDAKKNYLLGLGLNEDRIAELESALQSAGKAASEAGIESKDATPEPEPAPAAEVVEEEEATPAKEPQAEDKDQNPLTREEVATAIAGVITPLIDANRDQAERIAILEAELKELRVGAAAQIMEIKETTPALSLSELIAQNVIGKDAARVDGRSKLSKDGPKETEELRAITGIDRIDHHIRNTQK